MEFSAEGPTAIPMWINGHAFLTVTDDFFDVVNPATGEAVHRVPLAGAGEAAEAVAAARAAQPAWAEMGMNGPPGLPEQAGRRAGKLQWPLRQTADWRNGFQSCSGTS
jgi:hypothetical protein